MERKTDWSARLSLSRTRRCRWTRSWPTVDFVKLDLEIVNATALAFDLIATDTPPAFDAEVPATTFSDAEQLLRIVLGAEPDFGRFSPAEQASTQQFLFDLQNIVDAGKAAFDDSANATLLGGAVTLVSALADADCLSAG